MTHPINAAQWLVVVTIADAGIALIHPVVPIVRKPMRGPETSVSTSECSGVYESDGGTRWQRRAEKTVLHTQTPIGVIGIGPGHRTPRVHHAERGGIRIEKQ